MASVRATTLEGIRAEILDSIKGRKLGLSFDGYLQGQVAARDAVFGWTSGGSTVVSTGSGSTALTAYGISIVGSSGTSGATGYTLADPVPGVRKMIFCPTTGYANIVLASTLAGQAIISTGSVTSTYSNILFAGKGCAIEMIGLSTQYYAVLDIPVSTASTNVTLT